MNWPAKIRTWVDEVAAHTGARRSHWCSGSEQESAELAEAMLADKTLIALDADAFPASYLHRSHPSDVARTEHLTFICGESARETGPTNNWMSVEQAQAQIWPLFAGAMRDRTLYI
ncbi:MAG TPA: phosphoenolpyruvate carboxykinase, partial [Myxococcota bacterium]|nr:phosphoenolpyruvate carboxykinase [Myxococcota bacterium]